MDCSDPWDDPSTALTLSRFTFWFGGVVLTVVAAAGIVGNAVTIAIFSLRDMQRYGIRATVLDQERLEILFAHWFAKQSKR